MAAAEALHGRRSRERGLDAADRHRRVQPVARRFVPDLLARRPQRFSDRRTAAALQRAAGTVVRVLQAPRRGGRRRRPKENSFFDGIDTTIPGLFSAIRRPAPAGAAALLAAIDAEVKAASRRLLDEGSVRLGAGARARPRGDADGHRRSCSAEPDAVFILDVKEQQFVDAINTALGIELQATAQAPGSPEGSAMGPVVPGQTIEVRAALTQPRDGRHRADRNRPDRRRRLAARRRRRPSPAVLTSNQTARRHVHVSRCRRRAARRGPYFERASIAEPRYTIRRRHAGVPAGRRGRR